MDPAWWTGPQGAWRREQVALLDARLPEDAARAWIYGFCEGWADMRAVMALSHSEPHGSWGLRAAQVLEDLGEDQDDNPDLSVPAMTPWQKRRAGRLLSRWRTPVSMN